MVFTIFRINNCPFLLDLAHQNLDLLFQTVLLVEFLLRAFTLATNRAHGLSHVTREVCLWGVILLLYSIDWRLLRSWYRAKFSFESSLLLYYLVCKVRLAGVGVHVVDSSASSHCQLSLSRLSLDDRLQTVLARRESHRFDRFFQRTHIVAILVFNQRDWLASPLSQRFQRWSVSGSLVVVIEVVSSLLENWIFIGVYLHFAQVFEHAILRVMAIYQFFESNCVP